jgi:DNA-binding response OmpR family regulator
MRAPQVVVLEADGWIARHLADIAAEGAWLVRGVRSPAAAMEIARERRPSVLIVQAELAEENTATLRLISDASRACPDVPVIAVSDVKLSEADRAAWTAALFDLGARYVHFPPLTQSVLEDVVSGLMAARVRRVVGDSAPVGSAPKDPKRRRKEEDVIDLADEELHE